MEYNIIGRSAPDAETPSILCVQNVADMQMKNAKYL